MKPVMQKVYNSQRGDCFSACVASILELQLDDVPNFHDFDDKDFSDALDEWFNDRGMVYLEFDLTIGDATEFISQLDMVYTIGTIRSPRARAIRHAVVCKGGKIIHDPHPNQDGYNCELELLGFILPMNPANIKRSDSWFLCQ